MCEMLVMKVDKVNADPVLDPSLPKAGYVITVQNDGWPWSAEELNHPRWTIVKVPGAKVSDMDKLMLSEQAQLLSVNPLDPKADPAVNKALRQRAFALNIAALPSKTLAVADVTSATVALAPIANPLVIG